MRSMHLYGHLHESYIKRDLPAAQLASIDTHVSNCLFCAHAIADQAVVSTGWERRGWLRRLVQVDQPAAIDAVEELDARAAA
jgi:hypothetical protein